MLIQMRVKHACTYFKYYNLQSLADKGFFSRTTLYKTEFSRYERVNSRQRTAANHRERKEN